MAYGTTGLPPFDGCSEAELAWCGGLFEGEGCLSLIKCQAGHYPVASLNMVDRDVVGRFASLVRVGNFRSERQQQKRGWQQQWKWSTSGVHSVEVARVLLPLLGDRRRAKAQELIDWYVDTYLKECAECGDPFIAQKRNAVYCSRKCRSKVSGRAGTERRRERARLRPTVVIACGRCGIDFAAPRTSGCGTRRWCETCKPAVKQAQWRDYRRRKKAAVT